MKKSFLFLILGPLTLFAQVSSNSVDRFVPDSKPQQNAEYKWHDVAQWNAHLASEAAAKLKSYGSLKVLIEKSYLSDEQKKILASNLGSSQLSKKVDVTVKADEITLKMGSKQVVITMVNAAKEEFEINHYPVSLVGKTSLERLAYVKNVISFTWARKSTTHSLFSLVIHSAFAADKYVYSTEFDLSALGIATDQLFKISKDQVCDSYSGMNEYWMLALVHKTKNNGNAYATSNRDMAETGRSPLPKTALNLGEAFWCANHTAATKSKDDIIRGFNAVCEDKKIKSVTYATLTGVGKISANSQSELDKLVDKRFNKNSFFQKTISSTGSFSDSLKKCCANTECSAKINDLAPIPRNDATTPETLETNIENRVGPSKAPSIR